MTASLLARMLEVRTRKVSVGNGREQFQSQAACSMTHWDSLLEIGLDWLLGFLLVSMRVQ